MIEATYSISEAEFLEAQKLWCSREFKKLPGRSLVFVLSIVFGVFVGLSFQYLPTWLAGSLAGSLLAVCAASQWHKKAIRKYQYRLKADDMRTLHAWIDEAGYRSEQEGLCGGWISWTHFTGWYETPDIYVLGMGLSFVTVPRTSLSTEQQDTLRTLLKAKLGDRL